jgi:hypothetical protein
MGRGSTVPPSRKGDLKSRGRIEKHRDGTAVFVNRSTVGKEQVMWKKKLVHGFLGLAALMVAATPAAVSAEEPKEQAALHSRVMVFVSSSTTLLEATTLAGGIPEFENDGTYFGLSGEIYYGKLSLNGFIMDGTTKRLSGGTYFTAPTFNAVTHEHSTQIDVSVGYRVLEDNKYLGSLDVTAGYYRLWAEPDISPANWYDGPEIGVKGRRTFGNKLTLFYKIGYVPVYGVHGWMEGQMHDDHGNIMIYDGGLEYPIDERIAVAAGYRHIKLKAEVIEDESTALVTLSGFFGGLTFSF